jgi:hypothetical protein
MVVGRSARVRERLVVLALILQQRPQLLRVLGEGEKEY